MRAAALWPLALLLAISACGLFGPEEDGKVDPLSFTWTVDTLYYPGSLQIAMSNIWGASPKDVYTVGHNSNGAKMFHYDGKIWNPVALGVTRGGTTITTSFGMEDVYGFAGDDIWAVGYHRNLGLSNTSLVIHYNGYQWAESDTIEDEWLFSIGGSSSDDFWVGGMNGILYHYNGSDFTLYPMPVDIDSTDYHYIKAIAGSKNGIAYALLHNPSGGGYPQTYLLKFEAGTWELIEEAPFLTWSNIWLSPTGTLYAAGAYHLDRWENGSRTTLLDSTWYQNIHGISDADFYLSGRNNPYDMTVTVWHYNGTEFRRLPIPEVKDAYTAGIWTDGKEVFILAVIGNSTVVLHGK
ncbi:hypothetical protein ACFL6E_03060 [Candidatus Neomarinimicrobiota bacterium]